MRNAKGFTLIELLVVVAIIAILVAVLLPNVFAARQRANLSAAENFTRQLAADIEANRNIDGKLPEQVTCEINQGNSRLEAKIKIDDNSGTIKAVASIPSNIASGCTYAANTQNDTYTLTINLNRQATGYSKLVYSSATGAIQRQEQAQE